LTSTAKRRREEVRDKEWGTVCLTYSGRGGPDEKHDPTVTRGFGGGLEKTGLKSKGGRMKTTTTYGGKKRERDPLRRGQGQAEPFPKRKNSQGKAHRWSVGWRQKGGQGTARDADYRKEASKKGHGFLTSERRNHQEGTVTTEKKSPRKDRCLSISL